MKNMLQSQTLDFLKELTINNNREWFQDNKSQYEAALHNFKSFVSAVEEELQRKDEIERTKVFRIYRDVRFSHDKTPYKTNFSAGFTRAGKYRRGGFFFKVEPEHFYVAGGYWSPDKEDLKFIRDGIASDAQSLREAIENTEFVSRFSALEGEELKSSPRGYSKDHPEVDLLRKKQFIVSKQYPISMALKSGFETEVVDSFMAMVPMFDALRDMLIYDGNGEERG